MTTRFMRLHGNDLPLKRKPKKRRKPVVKKVIVSGACPLKKQAEALHKVLGWADTLQYHAHALGLVHALHDNGFRIAKIAPPIIIPKPPVQYADGAMP